MTQPTPAALEGLTFLQRGWLSSNNVLLHGAPGEGATLVDSGHCANADQTLALVRHALAGEALARVVNTHLHSDHCGGNAALQREFGMAVAIPPGLWDAVQRWDEDELSYRPTRQRCERFSADAVLAPGSTLRCGARAWEVLAAPGHDPHSVMLFDAAQGVLISADALWENGFGVVFPELDGVGAYDDVAAVLALIERLPVQWVLPGHGAPFEDVAGALARARSRLAGFRADPARHDRHAAKVLLKFHLLEERAQPLPALRAWLAAAPLMQGMWLRLGRPGASVEGWCDLLVAELCAAGVLALRDGVVCDV
ncbi:MAG: MBL fold metallo-hydrolase [Ideonella sp.]|nr:MBL fold metallo-hydrolase [Ideonella sp.]